MLQWQYANNEPPSSGLCSLLGLIIFADIYFIVLNKKNISVPETSRHARANMLPLDECYSSCVWRSSEIPHQPKMLGIWFTWFTLCPVIMHWRYPNTGQGCPGAIQGYKNTVLLSIPEPPSATVSVSKVRFRGELCSVSQLKWCPEVYYSVSSFGTTVFMLL